MRGSCLWLLLFRDRWMQCDDEAVRTAARGCLVVVLRDEAVHRVGELGGERRPVLGGGESHLAVDAERREGLSGAARPADQLADLADEAGRDGEQPAR